MNEDRQSSKIIDIQKHPKFTRFNDAEEMPINPPISLDHVRKDKAFEELIDAIAKITGIKPKKN